MHRMDGSGSIPPSEVQVSRRPAEMLGRKGIETRQRLMNAARDLLLTHSPVSLTVAAIARSAKTSSATFYVYFDDVVDVVLALASEASEDLDEVLDALVRWHGGLSPREGATAFITAFRAYYRRHLQIFGLRNMEADRGNERFLEIRGNAGQKILSRLAELIASGHLARSGTQLEDQQALARAAVIYSAIERLAASEDLYAPRPRAVSSEEIVNAQIVMLADLVAPPSA